VVAIAHVRKGRCSREEVIMEEVRYFFGLVLFWQCASVSR